MKKYLRRTFVKNLFFLIIAIFGLKYIRVVKAMDLKPYHHLPDGTFRNPPGSPSYDFSKNKRSRGSFFKFFYEGIVKKKIFGQDQIPNYIPKNHYFSQQKALEQYNKNNDNVKITWLGHASYIINIEGMTILTDPFLSKYAGPKGIGPKRFVKAGISIKNLPKIDLILISHSHYDHLDVKTLKKINNKKNIKVLVPLNLKKTISKCGYNNISELDWHDKEIINGIRITSVPAIHWSRRLGQKRNTTLWCGYMIQKKEKKIYFSGDVAYGEVFKVIGNKYGPVDLSIVPIGAYKPREMMRTSHVTPEEAVQVTKDIKSKNILGMHWGTIRLSAEDLWEPPIRFEKSAKLQGYEEKNVWKLAIGETKSLL